MEVTLDWSVGRAWKTLRRMTEKSRLPGRELLTDAWTLRTAREDSEGSEEHDKENAYYLGEYRKRQEQRIPNNFHSTTLLCTESVKLQSGVRARTIRGPLCPPGLLCNPPLLTVSKAAVSAMLPHPRTWPRAGSLSEPPLRMILENDPSTRLTGFL